MNGWYGVFWTILLGAIALAAGQPATAQALEEQIEETSYGELAEQAELSSLERIAPTVMGGHERLMQIAQAELVEVTGITVEETEQGVVLRLEASGELTVPVTSVSGNAAIANIPNTVLSLPEGEDFLVSRPAEGVALVSVSALPDNRVQIAITGTDAPPVVALQAEALGLAVNVSVGTVVGQRANEDTLQLSVTGERTEDDYFVPESTTATRTNTPIFDTPASIQVIPQQVLEDQQVISLEDALSNLSGVTDGGNFAGLDTDFNIRGFNNVPILRDGFRQFGFGNDGIPETANLERIEVLRGPASILYGAIQPGGVINLVTEQPLSEPFYEVAVQAGNRGLISPQIDLSGPLSSDERVLYRLNALYRNEESFRDYEQNIERTFIAPSLSWEISDRTDITIQLEYSDYIGPFEAGLPAVGDEVADVPASRITGELDDFSKVEYFRAGYNLEHRFNDSWQVQNSLRYMQQNISNEGVIGLFFLDEFAGIFSRGLSQQYRFPRDFGVQTNLIGEFNTGSIEHTLLLGLDLNRSTETDSARFSDFADFQPLNIFDPDYGTFDGVDVDDLPPLRVQKNESNRLGLYVQDQIDLLDNLILVAGLRYDTIRQKVTSFPASAFDDEITETTQSEDAWIPRVGIVYQPIEEISLYGSYSQSFNLNDGVDVNGSPLRPERGEGFEVGIKTEILEGDLLATLAYFDVSRQNVATADPNDPFAQVATGEQRSQGVEFDLVGEILPGWNILVSYAYIDARVTEDNTIPEGNRVFNAPEHSANLWTTYEIQRGDLRGLGFGGGVNFVGERSGDLENTFDVDSYLLTNASVFYRRDSWQATISARNLFDVNYISSTQNARFGLNEPGAPLTIVGSVSFQF